MGSGPSAFGLDRLTVREQCEGEMPPAELEGVLQGGPVTTKVRYLAGCELSWSMYAQPRMPGERPLAMLRVALGAVYLLTTPTNTM